MTVTVEYFDRIRTRIPDGNCDAVGCPIINLNGLPSVKALRLRLPRSWRTEYQVLDRSGHDQMLAGGGQKRAPSAPTASNASPAATLPGGLGAPRHGSEG
jgi:hypothetical protein